MSGTLAGARTASCALGQYLNLLAAGDDDALREAIQRGDGRGPGFCGRLIRALGIDPRQFDTWNGRTYVLYSPADDAYLVRLIQAPPGLLPQRDVPTITIGVRIDGDVGTILGRWDGSPDGLEAFDVALGDT